MARIRRPKRRRQSKSLAITQILMLTGILALMLIFRQHIGDTMSTLLDSFGQPASDVQIVKDEDQATTPDSPPGTTTPSH